MSVHEISPGNAGPSPVGYGIQPEQMLPEESMTPEWYLKNARYIASQFNPVLFNFQVLQGATNPDIAQRFSSRSIIWYSYYFGAQQVSEHNHIVMDEQNAPLPVRMFQDQTIPSLINHMLGNVKDVVNVLPEIIQAVGLSEDIVSLKELKRDIAKYKLDFASVNDTYKALGVAALPGLEFDAEEKIQEYFEESAKEMAEEIMENFAVHGLYTNFWKDLFTLATRDAFVTGVGAIKIYEQGGKPKMKRIPVQNLIFDTSITSSQNRGARYAGEVYQMTPSEIADRWGSQLGYTRLKEIEIIAKNQRFQTPFNTMLPNTNLLFWTNGNTGLPLVTCVDTYWVSFKKVDEKFMATVRKATLIGNKFVVDFGPENNIVEDKFNPSDTSLPIKVVTPVIEFGYPQGVVERLYRMSDLLSMYRTKLIQMIQRSKGKNYILRAWKLPEGLRTPEILSDFSRMGMTVVNDAGEEEDVNARMVEPVDMTLDPGVTNMLGIIAEMKAVMEDVASMPAQVRGNVSGYQSIKSLQMSKAQSNKGIQIYYDAMFDFFENVIAYYADVSKTLACRDEFIEAPLIVGDKQVKYLKAEAKDIKFSSLLVFLRIEDSTSEQERQEIMADVQAAVNRGELTGMDILKLRTFKSKRKMVNYLTMRYKQNLKMAQQAQQAADAKEMAINAINAKAQVDSTAISAEAGLEKQQMIEQNKSAEPQ